MSYSKSFFYYNSIHIDLYGFGKSTINHELNLIDYANGVEKILEENNLYNVTLIGHSFGGRVALLLTTFSKRVKGLVLVDSAGLKPRFSIKKKIKILDYKIKKKLNLNTKKCGSSDYKALDEIMKKTFVNIVNYHLDDELKKINVPTLIVWGKKDIETPIYMAHRLLKGIKNSRLVLLNGGHFAYVEDKNLFINILKAYLLGLYDNI